MKRKRRMKMEIFSSFPLFWWQLCSSCNQEFRRIKGWRRLVGPYHGGIGHWERVCSDCAPTKDDAQKRFEEFDV